MGVVVRNGCNSKLGNAISRLAASFKSTTKLISNCGYGSKLDIKYIGKLSDFRNYLFTFSHLQKAHNLYSTNPIHMASLDPDYWLIVSKLLSGQNVNNLQYILSMNNAEIVYPVKKCKL